MISRFQVNQRLDIYFVEIICEPTKQEESSMVMELWLWKRKILAAKSLPTLREYPTISDGLRLAMPPEIKFLDLVLPQNTPFLNE